jgi:hypothetical protein
MQNLEFGNKKCRMRGGQYQGWCFLAIMKIGPPHVSSNNIEPTQKVEGN